VLPTGEGREATNSYLVWDGAADDPVVDRHDKRYIQPFGEWLPLREPLEALFPVARTAGHFVPGDGNGLVDAAGVGVGVAICFEIAFDAAAREPVSHGAQLLAVPTNNATFGRSPLTSQQLAMSRAGAEAHRATLLNAAAGGVSAQRPQDGHQHRQAGDIVLRVVAWPEEAAGAGTMPGGLARMPQFLAWLVGLTTLAWALIRSRAR